MKIVRVKTIPVEVPLEQPIATAIHQIRSFGCVLVVLETDAGISGEGFAITLNAVRLKALHEMILSFVPRLTGRDPHYVSAIGQEIWNEANPVGHKGFAIDALSALDNACWDLVAKAAGQPLYKIFGACRDRVKTYASGGLWLSQSIDDCSREAQAFIESGFDAMKIRIGSARIADDVERVRQIRSTVGSDVELLVDANQAFTPKHAIRLGRELEPFDIAWFEEPVPYHQLRGYAEVRAALDIPIAGGETEYTSRGMGDMLNAEAVDVLMPDLQRVGGLSEFRRSAAIAAAHDIPVSTHLFTEQSITIAASEPNCISLEHMAWFSPLYNEAIEVADGYIDVPQRPGSGFTFSQLAIERYRLD